MPKRTVHVGRYSIGFRSSMPSYVQERDDTPPIYRAGIMPAWVASHEQKEREIGNGKAVDLLDSILKVYHDNNT